MEHSSSSSNLKAALDGPLHALGFQLEQLTPKRVTGHLRVTENNCQVIFFFFFLVCIVMCARALYSSFLFLLSFLDDE